MSEVMERSEFRETRSTEGLTPMERAALVTVFSFSYPVFRSFSETLETAIKLGLVGLKHRRTFRDALDALVAKGWVDKRSERPAKYMAISLGHLYERVKAEAEGKRLAEAREVENAASRELEKMLGLHEGAISNRFDGLRISGMSSTGLLINVKALVASGIIRSVPSTSRSRKAKA